MIVALNCGGGSVQLPGATATSAIASDGRTASSCAATTPTAASLTAITQPSTASFLRVIFTAEPLPSSGKARTEGPEAHAGSAGGIETPRIDLRVDLELVEARVEHDASTDRRLETARPVHAALAHVGEHARRILCSRASRHRRQHRGRRDPVRTPHGTS